MITVAICTYNRSELLPLAIRALAESIGPASTWELLVVDNGSTDGTVDSFLAATANWPEDKRRIVLEPVTGLSHARNRALRESDADIVAFIDDDSLVCPEWLRAIQEMFDDHPKAAVVGGPIHVQWLDAEPEWMHPDLLSYFSGLDYGTLDCKLTFPRYPYGANFCVRREVALQVGGFRTDLGYSGSSLIGGEETELAHRIEDAGWEVWYAARASVQHLISGKRASVEWLIDRARSSGTTAAMLAREHLRGIVKVRQIINDLRWLRYAAAERAKKPGTNPEAVRREIRYWQALGVWDGWKLNKTRTHQTPLRSSLGSANG